MYVCMYVCMYECMYVCDIIQVPSRHVSTIIIIYNMDLLCWLRLGWLKQVWVCSRKGASIDLVSGAHSLGVTSPD